MGLVACFPSLVLSPSHRDTHIHFLSLFFSFPSYLFSGLPDLLLQFLRYHFTSTRHRFKIFSYEQTLVLFFKKYEVLPPPTRLPDPVPITFHLFPQSKHFQYQSQERRLPSSWSNDTKLKGTREKRETWIHRMEKLLLII